MGYSYAHNISKAADYLLEILCSEIHVDYSRFYDGSEETEERLREEMGVDRESVCSLIDLAAIQLEEQGIVKTTALDVKLADEHPDYRIELTEEGCEKLVAGYEPKFRDME